MRYILVPPNLDVVNPVLKEEGTNVPFVQFVEELLLDQRFSKDIRSIDVAFEITAALERWKENPTKYIALETEHYERLNEVAKAPTGGYKPGLGVQMRPFIKAITGALESAPRDEPEEEAS